MEFHSEGRIQRMDCLPERVCRRQCGWRTVLNLATKRNAVRLVNYESQREREIVEGEKEYHLWRREKWKKAWDCECEWTWWFRVAEAQQHQDEWCMTLCYLKPCSLRFIPVRGFVNLFCLRGQLYLRLTFYVTLASLESVLVQVNYTLFHCKNFKFALLFSLSNINM